MDRMKIKEVRRRAGTERELAIRMDQVLLGCGHVKRVGEQPI